MKKLRGKEALKYSMFYDVLFPEEPQETDGREYHNLKLVKTVSYLAPLDITIKEQAFVVFDIETTGLDTVHERIIELGAIRLEAGTRKVTRFQTLLSIPSKIPYSATLIHGITDAMLRGAPTFNEVAYQFLRFIDGAVLVAHNAEFDFSFLRNEYYRCDMALHWSTYCTLKMARRVLPGRPSYKLDALADHYGFDFSARHRSIGDCEVTVKVLGELMKKKAPSNLGDLKMFEVKDK